MSDEQKPAAPTEAAPAAPAAEWKPPTREEWETTQRALKERNAENKANREKAEAAVAKAAAEERAKMEAEGNLKGLLEAERKRAEDLAAKAARAEEFEGALKRRLDATLARLPEERRQRIAALGLSPAAQLDLAEEFASLAAGPAKAPGTTAGNPAAPVVTQSIKDMTPQQLRQHMATLTPAQLRELGAQHGVSAGPSAGWKLPTKG